MSKSCDFLVSCSTCSHWPQHCRLPQKIALGKDYPSYATSLNNLVQLYRVMGTYTKAEPLYVQVLEIRKQVLGEEHPEYANSFSALAGLYRAMKDYAKAEPLARQGLHVSGILLERLSVVLSERQQLAMGQMLRHQLDRYVSLSLETGQFQASSAREELRWKGATLVR